MNLVSRIHQNFLFPTPAPVMDDDEAKPVLFDPPAVDDAVLVFDRHSASASASEPNSVFSVALDPTGSVAVSGGEDDKAFVWRVADGSVLFECSGHQVLLFGLFAYL